MKKKFEEITIIGPGLIGGSIGLNLKKKKLAKRIIGIDNSKRNLVDALERGIIDDYKLKIDDTISKSEVIFICTPVSSINSILDKIIPFMTKKNIITDTGSVKNIFK